MNTHRNNKKVIALLCMISLFASSILPMAGANMQGKGKKPTLSNKTVSLNVGKTKKVTIKNAKGTKITWKTKNSNIVTVKKNGKYAAMLKAKKVGKAKVIANVKKGNKRYTLTCNVTVKTSKPVSTSATATFLPTKAPVETPINTLIPVPTTTEPTMVPTVAPTVIPTTAPTVAPTVIPTTAPTVAPTVIPTTAPTVAPTATPTVVPTNMVEGSTVKKQSANTNASVSDGKAIVTFTGASRYSQADYLLASSVTLSNVESIQYTLSITGTPDTVCFKLYDSAANELSAATQYNKKTGTYIITITEELKAKTVSGYAIMTNSNMDGTTQTATAELTELKFVLSSAVEPTITPAPTATPSSEEEQMTLSAATFLGAGAVNGNPVYNQDGSVTITATKSYGGGGIVFYINTSKLGVNLSDYTKVVYVASANVSVPVCFNRYTTSGYWDSNQALGYSQLTTEQKIFSYSLPEGENALGFGVKFNASGDISSLPSEVEITIHSITLLKDMRDTTDAITQYSKLSELAAAYGFKMGTVMSSTTVADSKYSDLMKYHFNSITAANEMKAYSMLDESKTKAAYANVNSMPVLKFDAADQIMDYAKVNGLKLRGHTLVWDAGMKDWFFCEGYDSSKGYASSEVIKARLKNYIEQVITHFEEKYPGVIYCWDVVNEAVGDSASEYEAGDARHVRTIRSGEQNLFYNTIGSNYVELSFLYAYAVIEDLRNTSMPNIDIKLYYNDYSTFYANKRDAICSLVSSINSYQSDGHGGYIKLCDGVGMQSYIGGFGQQEGCMNEGDIALIKTAIQKFASLGVEVQATELAVRNYQNDAQTLAKHAAFYEKLFQTYIDINSGTEKPLTAVSIWGIVDNPNMDSSDYSFRMNGTYCGLFDKDLKIKDSFVKIYNLMKK